MLASKVHLKNLLSIKYSDKSDYFKAHAAIFSITI